MNQLPSRSFLLCSMLALFMAGCGGATGSDVPALPASPDSGGSGQGGSSGGQNNGGTSMDTIIQANIQHNLQQLNAYRAAKGLAVLTLDAGLSDFARQGSIELMANHTPHKHFSDAGERSTLFGADGFRSAAAENQGDPNGWTPMPVNAAIDDILRAMIAEGPGGGHHDTILNPNLKRVGVGLVLNQRGQLYLTNDFSG